MPCGAPAASSSPPLRYSVTLLDYGAGNIQSLRNALTKVGCNVIDVHCKDDILQAERLIFPGVGAFDTAIQCLHTLGYFHALREYVLSGRPFFGMCLGMQVLFDGSTEGKLQGLGIIPGMVERFNTKVLPGMPPMPPMPVLPVPHIGWNSLTLRKQEHNSWTENLFAGTRDEKFYFVHSYRAVETTANKSWILSYTDYGERFISSVCKGNVMATQFHPEKSSTAGLNLLRLFLERTQCTTTASDTKVNTPQLSISGRPSIIDPNQTTELCKRVIACLDVRSNDDGDLVVTKGDSYNVRESTKDAQNSNGKVRNLGKPVDLAERYYLEGADEITFLNITSFRSEPIADIPMIELLEKASRSIFVPLCIGGGIRDYTDSAGEFHSALEVAAAYFRAGADKISISSDAVFAAEGYYAAGKQKQGSTSIELIAKSYGAQAVVVSVDPRRVYVSSPSDTPHHTVHTEKHGPNGEEYVWFQCTIKGGREGRDLDVVQLVCAVEALGAGELLVNSIDADGSKKGFDIDLLQQICSHVTLPVIASSGAGCKEHFTEVFQKTNVSAALAAGIFHRREVSINEIKFEMASNTIPTRQ